MDSGGGSEVDRVSEQGGEEVATCSIVVSGEDLPSTEESLLLEDQKDE